MRLKEGPGKETKKEKELRQKELYKKCVRRNYFKEEEIINCT
jgi:hypothetical protein